MTQETLVPGGGPTGLELATGLDARGHAVATVVAATSCGARTPSFAGAAPGTSDADRAGALVDDPSAIRPANRTAFEDAGVETTRAATALAGAATDAGAPDGGPTAGKPTGSTGTVAPG